jgi:chromosome segregation ATPase
MLFDAFIQAAMKLKDAEERLKKAEADKNLINEQLEQELRRTRAQLNEFVQTLGYRSSYAAQAAESARSVVELLMDQKKELQDERDALKKEVSSLLARLDETERQNCQMAKDLSHMKTTAEEDAKAKVQDEMETLQSEQEKLLSDRVRLEGEVKNLMDQVESWKEATEHKRNATRLVEMERKQHQHQMERCMSENTSLREANKSLADEKEQLESKVMAINGYSV